MSAYDNASTTSGETAISSLCPHFILWKFCDECRPASTLASSQPLSSSPPRLQLHQTADGPYFWNADQLADANLHPGLRPENGFNPPIPVPQTRHRPILPNPNYPPWAPYAIPPQVQAQQALAALPQALNPAVENPQHDPMATEIDEIHQQDAENAPPSSQESRDSITWTHGAASGQGGTHVCACGKTFDTASVLKRHSRSHEKPHVCDVCRKKFSWSNHLQRHKEVHAGEQKPSYLCPSTGCPTLFSRTYNIPRHLQSKHGMDKEQAKQLVSTVYPQPPQTSHM